MIAEQATVDPSDYWYVAMAPGETKVLTLEQLDDLFRLDIIDASTRIWQPGMSEWLPLSVVAGLDAPAPAPAPNRPPPPSTRRPVQHSAPPPPQRQQPVQAAQPWPPAPVSQQRPTAYAQTVPVANAWPPVSVNAQPVITAPVESFRPMVLSGRPSAMPKSGGGAGRFVMALALLAGTGVTLYRNDVVRQAALSAGQESTYMQLERALGGPGFGTPRAVHALQSVSPASAAATLSPSSASLPSTTSTARPSPVAEVTPPAPAATAATPAPVTTTTTSEPSRPTTQALTAALTTHATSPSKKSSAAETRRSASRPEPRGAGRPARSEAEPASKGLGFKGSSNTYDPLNGKL